MPTLLVWNAEFSLVLAHDYVKSLIRHLKTYLREDLRLKEDWHKIILN